MKSNELRIGNLVNANGDMLSVTGADIAYFDFNGNDYSPIPLTPEILEKAGFSKGEKWFIHQVYYRNYFDLCVNRNEIIYGQKTEHGFDKRSINIKYLHQLQNLYFALTGEELPIEL